MLADVKTVQARFIVVAGDLSGFSAFHHDDEGIHIEMYLRHYYELVEMAVDAAGGRLIKFIGDGYMAVWDNIETSSPFLKKRSAVVTEMTHALSNVVAIGNLNVPIDSEHHLYMRHGIAYEGNGARLTYTRDTRPETDYLGTKVNMAFRFESIANQYPFIVADKIIINWMERPGDEWIERSLTPAEIAGKFKGTGPKDGVVYQLQLTDEIERQIAESIYQPPATVALRPFSLPNYDAESKQDVISFLKGFQTRMLNTQWTAKGFLGLDWLKHRIGALVKLDL
jgi:class 3 adenylate cyclase